MGLTADSLPVFPWDRLEPLKTQAAAHPAGLIDLSVGTPVDPVPEVMQEALRTASDTPGYPAVAGTAELRQAVVDHYARRRRVPDLPLEAVLPTIGSKEAVALLPALLGFGSGDVVIHPTVAYPTYDVGAKLAGAATLLADSPEDLAGRDIKGRVLVWLNSPSNPTGRVMSAGRLANWVSWARQRGAIVAADECYAGLAWEEPWASDGVPSLLDRRVTGGRLDGLVALYSLSKQSNAAGYRAAFLAGDPVLVDQMRQLRRHIGLMMPAPIQAAMIAALADDAAVAAQRRTYQRRRLQLLAALTGAGYLVEGSEAGLYLWFTTPGAQDGWRTVADLASLGILAAPGEFYGTAGQAYCRMALTASDAAVAEAAARLAGA
ncbi:MAG: succinyldiaminopimelate transaminase [Bifidobacteriaceae bacterium]|jgi:succinyldiaminopimelate transaminase|nr:succinyldiaminopimelate transaminase [Bifidobacteriaceae bacterium]